MADGGLLALMACLGLAQLSHETTSYLAQLASAPSPCWPLRPWPTTPAGGRADGDRPAGLALSGAPSLASILGLGIAVLTWHTRGTDLQHQGTWAIWWLCRGIHLLHRLETRSVGMAPGIPWVEGKEWQSLGRLLPGSAGRLAAGAVDAVALAPSAGSTCRHPT
jgi:hypothetical protein